MRTAEGSMGHDGLSILLIPKGTKGVSFSSLPKVGNNALPSFEVVFDNAEVPLDSLMGEEGRGFSPCQPCTMLVQAWSLQQEQLSGQSI